MMSLREVVVGDLTESGATQEQATIGETPNIAARLQTTAEAKQPSSRARNSPAMQLFHLSH
jgi:class 3 adenylate cyclase